MRSLQWGESSPAATSATKCAPMATTPIRSTRSRELSSYDVTIANLEGDLSATSPPRPMRTRSTFVPAADDRRLTMAGIDAVTQANNHRPGIAKAGVRRACPIRSMRWRPRGLRTFRRRPIPRERARPIDRNRRRQEDRDHRHRRRDRNDEARELGRDGRTRHGSAAKVCRRHRRTRPALIPISDTSCADISADWRNTTSSSRISTSAWSTRAFPRIGRCDGAQAAIDAGATLVVTNHPHVIQGMEIYNGKPIVYSVGNFIFDQMFSVQMREGIILEIVLRGGKIVGLRTKRRRDRGLQPASPDDRRRTSRPHGPLLVLHRPPRQPLGQRGVLGRDTRQHVHECIRG